MLQRVFVILLFGCINNIRTDDSIGSDLSDLNENYLKRWENEFYSKLLKDLTDEKKVRIDLYYEVFCPHCINFEKEKFGPIVKTMSQYLDIHTYPYGNAKTIEENGEIHFECQHGPLECYGNKLHACALDNLEHTKALLYNVCLMNGTKDSSSNDKKADECGQSMGVDSGPIKVCAKGKRGNELLKYYGEESKKANFKHVPYVLVNGKKFDGDDFKKYVCAAFKIPPPPCI